MYKRQDTNLYINESSLEVASENKVQLLVDSVVSTAVQDLKDSAVDQVDAITNGHEAQFYYLDLVDTDNGNTVVTTKDKHVTLFFPYPEGTDADTAFHIVHYVNQDRDESAKDEIADVNEGSEKFAIEVYSEENQNLETTDQGIQITVTSFSPFGLFWEEDSGSSGGHTGGGGSSRPSRPTLNTEDQMCIRDSVRTAKRSSERHACSLEEGYFASKGGNKDMRKRILSACMALCLSLIHI